jgi:hypothetical protein
MSSRGGVIRNRRNIGSSSCSALVIAGVAPDIGVAAADLGNVARRTRTYAITDH